MIRNLPDEEKIQYIIIGIFIGIGVGFLIGLVMADTTWLNM
jgi:ABC-type antimicrobial peptide transport system permease subunit